MDLTERRALSPEWGEAGRVHDWRNYVPEKARALWTSFTIEQRMALVEWADDLASREEWE